MLAGRPWFDAVFAALDSRVRIDWRHADGDAERRPGRRHAERAGRALVTGERTALTPADAVRHGHRDSAVDALAGSRTRVLDTRKTLPGLRAAQKYAVRCGGGSNHRQGLFDAVLIKENHIAAGGSIGAAVAAIRALHPAVRVEVEVESLAELDAALTAGADMIMLDDFPLAELERATAQVAGRALVEISGNVTLARLAELGRVGADFVSVGSLTKHVRAIDFSMRIRA